MKYNFISVLLSLSSMTIFLPNELRPQESHSDRLTKFYLACTADTASSREGLLAQTPPADHDMELNFLPSGIETAVEDPEAPIQKDRVSFSWKLDGDIPGGLYEAVLHLATSKEDKSNVAFEVSIMLENETTSSEIAKTVVAGTSAKYRQFTLRLIGKDPEARTGDLLKLVIKNMSGYESTMKCGSSDEYLSYIEAPW